MIYAFDTYYLDNQAKTVCIGFEDWTSADYVFCIDEVTQIENEYISGAFYKRELPCIISVLQKIDLKTSDLIIIDGFVVLDDDGKPGLGAHLYEQLNRKYPIIGIAKTNFATLNSLKREVVRGQSKKPLYITAMGLDPDRAARNIHDMKGEFRIPDLLKKLDLLTRT